MDPATLTPTPGTVNSCDINELPADVQQWLRTHDMYENVSGYATTWHTLNRKGLSLKVSSGLRACYGQLEYRRDDIILLPVCRPYKERNDTTYDEGLDKFRRVWYDEVFFRPGSIYQRVFDKVPHMRVTTMNPDDVRYKAARTSIADGAPETVALIIDTKGLGKLYQPLRALTIMFRQPWEHTQTVYKSLPGTTRSYDYEVINDLIDLGMDPLRAYVGAAFITGIGHGSQLFNAHSVLDSTARMQDIPWFREFMRGEIDTVNGGSSSYTQSIYPSYKTYGYNELRAVAVAYKALNSFKSVFANRKSAQTAVIAINKWFDEVVLCDDPQA